MAEPERRRRRLRHGSTGGNGTAGAAARTADGRTAETSATYDPPPEQPGAVRRNAEPTAAAEERDGERGLRSLVGSGSSQVSPGAALRARDAARPTEADLAEAERSLVIVRRNWVPREDLPRTGR